MPRIEGDSPKLVNRGAAGLLKAAPGAPDAPTYKFSGKKDKITKDLLPLACPIGKPEYDPQNARLHPEESIDVIKMSLDAYGQRTPIVVNRRTGHVLKGNGTLEAARALGWTKIAAVWTEDDEATAAGYGLADNRSAEMSRWDFQAAARLQKLVEAKGGTMIGWSGAELLAMRMKLDATPAQADEDAVPEPPKKAVSKVGDLWLLGHHRLVCGDSADPKVASRAMDGEKAFLMATDPPYGVEFGKANHNPTAKEWNPVLGDDRQGKELRAWLAAMLRTWMPSMWDNAAWYIWSASLGEGHRFYEAIIDAGLHVQSQVVWAKNVFAMGQADYQWKHEPAWYAFKKGEKHRWLGGRDKTTVWEVKRLATSAYLHPMQKPVELYERPLLHHTHEGEVVAEPFAGSGTQFIAAQKLNRVCYGVELDPVYCDVIIERWQQFTGKKAKRG